MNFEQVPEFRKDLKWLSKKWRSLPEDIKAAERDILPLYIEQEGVSISKLREAFFGGYKAANKESPWQRPRGIQLIGMTVTRLWFASRLDWLLGCVHISQRQPNYHPCLLSSHSTHRSRTLHPTSLS